ncbi:hypothetical protein NDU88_004336 [Pleurodeles waltl]|uniref:Uncharacterized protein n=1 Tax=Pleurodeles waltl TaxID=8319 RepID=A0AAV7T7I0_PLEWA|nr:hypothetical protein NDU88_004336 [Pleurodeles waltl]
MRKQPTTGLWVEVLEAFLASDEEEEILAPKHDGTCSLSRTCVFPPMWVRALTLTPNWGGVEAMLIV